MSVEEFKAKARKHWKEFLPEKVRELRAEGRLEEALQGAAQLAQDQVNHLTRHQAYQQHEAEEVALHQFVYLPPEPEELDEELAEKEREYQRTPPGIPHEDENE